MHVFLAMVQFTIVFPAVHAFQWYFERVTFIPEYRILQKLHYGKVALPSKSASNNAYVPEPVARSRTGYRANRMVPAIMRVRQHLTPGGDHCCNVCHRKNCNLREKSRFIWTSLRQPAKRHRKRFNHRHLWLCAALEAWWYIIRSQIVFTREELTVTIFFVLAAVVLFTIVICFVCELNCWRRPRYL